MRPKPGLNAWKASARFGRGLERARAVARSRSAERGHPRSAPRGCAFRPHLRQAPWLGIGRSPRHAAAPCRGANRDRALMRPMRIGRAPGLRGDEGSSRCREEPPPPAGLYDQPTVLFRPRHQQAGAASAAGPRWLQRSPPLVRAGLLLRLQRRTGRPSTAGPRQPADQHNPHVQVPTGNAQRNITAPATYKTGRSHDLVREGTATVHGHL